MQLQLKPCLKLTPKLRLSAQMKLAMHILQMPLAKLKEFIKEQAEVNPLLEIKNNKELAWSFSGREKIPLQQENYNFDAEKENYLESLVSVSPTLQEHLLGQLRLMVDADEDLKIGELIIGNLDDNGYHRCPLEEIANPAQIDPSGVERALSLIQALEPLGVGARDLRECLLLQLKARGEENSLAGQIVDKYLPCLEKKRYSYIARKISAAGKKVSVAQIQEAMRIIAGLEPKPGRNFCRETAMRLIPDAALTKNAQGYEVVFNDGELPQLTINNKYKQMIKQEGIAEEAKEYLRERLATSRYLMYALRKRKETISKIMEEVISLQQDFLDNGEPYFKPLTLEYIAKKIGRHKSTVSRAIANKYVETPWGILALRSFFSSGIRQENGTLFSSKAAKSQIKELIEEENKEKPLTDQEITYLLQQKGISLSRRAVAKYRYQLRILSSKSRKK